VIILLLALQVDINAELYQKDINRALTIGDPFEVLVTVNHPRDADISMPYVDTLEPFMVIDRKSQRIEEGGAVKEVYRFTLVSFDTGELKIPPFKFIVHSEGLSDTLLSNDVDITVASVLPDEMQDINDIKGPVRFPNFRPLIIGAIILMIAATGYIAYRYFRRIRRSGVHARPLPPPWIEAILALERLPVDEWLARGNVKKYYYSLSEILKRYLERRFEFRAVEQTTTEIVNNMRTLRIPQRDEFNRFFTNADLVKYAKYVPPGSEVASAIDDAKELVNKTKPDEPAQEQR